MSVNCYEKWGKKSWILFVHPQLPVPIAVLFLMYREQLIPCCPSSTPRLLDKDELAMETQQGAEGPDVEQKEHEAGGKEWFLYRSPIFKWIMHSFFVTNTGKKNTINAFLCATICHLWRSVSGHGDIFSCCQNDNLRGLPVSFFMIHILGGMVLFMTDGIVVSEGCR